MSDAGFGAEKFDSPVATRRLSGERIIWTAGTIAERIGTSADFVRDVLVKEPGSPVKLVGGRYAAVESELIDWFRPTRLST